MNKNLYSGKLIAVDGPNGAGKTTIIQELKKELEKLHFALFGGRKCVLERSLCGA